MGPPRTASLDLAADAALTRRRHRMGRRAPCRRVLTSGTRGEEPALLLPPSLTAAGEPQPLPMERTSLTVSVDLCASTTVSVPSY
jgi:hypothetical protein